MKKFKKVFLMMAVLLILIPLSHFSQSNPTNFQVTVNVTLSTGFEPINVRVELSGFGYEYTDSSGIVIFGAVPEGFYDISSFKAGYDMYRINNTLINSDKVFNILLSEKKYPPTCLDVDPLTLKATWCKPLITALDENFEDPVFPPAGWQALSEQVGWERTNNGSSGGWIIPPWDSYYAMTNDDAVGGGPGNGCCDYLITPAVDLRESEDYQLTFDSFYDGANGQLAFVEYSVDAGETWELFAELVPDSGWTNLELDLGPFSGLAGPPQIWFAFHADDAGEWASGWAIDNVKIRVPETPANYIDFWVFLDTTHVGVTTGTIWDFAPLMYGQTYSASVAARYTSGLSAKDYFTFSCEYLFPPDSLTATAPDDAAILVWDPPWEFWPVIAAATDGSRDVGDVIYAFPAPSPISLCWGICDDGENLWITDPNMSSTTIYEVTYNGEYTGVTITVSLGQSFVGDMVSDGEYLYGCLVGGPNTIVKVDLATGETVGTISGDWTVTSQRGLAADFVNEEFYIGGWSSNQIWRTTFDGETISTFGFAGVSGLAWQPLGGIDQEGSLWIVVNSANSLVTEVDPNNGWTTIQSFTMPGGQPNSGAGAEIKLTDPDGCCLWLTNQSDNHIYLVDLDEPCCPPLTGQLPANLLGYNIYRDGAFRAYTPHVPPGEYVPQGYVDEGISPGMYFYTVTAVYDLAPYGFPDETGESMEEGPAEITSCFCFELDFIENWDMGTFEDNNWTADSANWSVNSQYGNPSPAAEFTWDPIQENYSIGLESYPISAVGMTEGKIWFDFDLKLDAVQPTGEEILHVQVWNWETDTWSTVAEYSNAEGSFGWTTEHINIRALAMNKAFRVRFLATGANSMDILSWFVDNIHIYRMCDGPTGLTATAVYNVGIVLNWSDPNPGSIDEYIHWDDGVNSGNSIGTGSAVEFDVAARWEPAQLAEYEGASVTQIAFFPAEAQCTYNIRVWIGDNAANLVVDQNVPDPLIGQWNYVDLATPVPVDITQELWVGYYVNAQAGYPAGVDNGPAIDGYGNMINFGGWQTLLQINPDQDCNWNIAAHLLSAAGVDMPLTRGVDPYTNTNAMTFTSNPNIIRKNNVFATGNDTRDLMGYNIYRSVNSGEYVLVHYWTEGTWYDPDEYLIPGTLYCYMVTAVWESESDECESAFSNEACVLWTGITDHNDADPGRISLYPNPANDHVFITSSTELKRVTIYNSFGQLVVNEITTGKQYELNTANCTIGVYMVRVETIAGITTRTLTIQR
jgi:hypothetical protein